MIYLSKFRRHISKYILTGAINNSQKYTISYKTDR